MDDSSSKEFTELEKSVGDLKRRVSRIEGLLTRGTHKTAKKPLSIREFVLQKSPRSDNDKTLCIAYFIEIHENTSPVTIEDLRKGFVCAKEKVPANLNDKVNQNIRKGYMMESGEEKDGKKAWILTNLGEKCVESDFSRAK